MPNILPDIRNAVRALILNGNKVLLLKKEDEKGSRYALPGGGQETGETLEQTLLRECAEELGCEVAVKDLLQVVDYFRDRAAEPATVRHLVEFLLVCEMPAEYIPQNGPRPDKYQVDVVWADIEELRHFPVFPKSLVAHINANGASNQRVYLGKVEK